MSASAGYLLAIIAVMAAVTYGIRAFPFVLFGLSNRVPPVAVYLGKTLSPAAIAMLVIYCFRRADFTVRPFALPELLSAAAVVALHLRWKNPLCSIFFGTALYMVLIHLGIGN